MASLVADGILEHLPRARRCLETRSARRRVGFQFADVLEADRARERVLSTPKLDVALH